jgi:hypothetical protein
MVSSASSNADGLSQKTSLPAPSRSTRTILPFLSGAFSKHKPTARYAIFRLYYTTCKPENNTLIRRNVLA